MSGYSRRPSGRRDRSQSPSRRDEPRYQRGSYRERGNLRGGNRVRGQQDSSEGFGSRNYSIEEGNFISNLPDVPDIPPIPKNSGEIPYQSQVDPRGTLGEPIEVLCNSYSLRTLPWFSIYCYDLAFRVPPESQLKGNDKLTAGQLARAHIQMMGILDDKGFVFDGVSLGWSPNELVPSGKWKTSVINMGVRHDGHPNNVEFKISNRGRLDIRRLVQLFQTDDPLPLNPLGDANLEIQFKWLQAVFRHFPSMQMVTRPKSQSYFDSDLPKKSLESTGHVLQALRGIYQSVQLRFRHLTINVDTATSVFWSPDRSLIDLVCAVIGLRSSDTLTQEFTSSPNKFFHACTRLIGLYFHIKHLKTDYLNARRIRFTSWSTGDSHTISFEENGIKTTVFDYYARKYNITLRFPELPLVMSSGAAYPLELGFSCPGERYKGVLKGQETADLLKFATAQPFIRQRQIGEGVKKLAWHSQPVPKLHGLSVSTQMLQLRARVLPAPQIRYRGNQSKTPADGRWDLRGINFFNPCQIKSYVLLYLPSGGRAVDEQRVSQLARELTRGFSATGISVPSTAPLPTVLGNYLGSAREVLQDALAKAQGTFGKAPDLIILAGSDIQYSVYKQELDCNLGVASQFLLEAKALKCQAQYIANCSSKVNVKLGGCVSVVDEPVLRRAKTMIIGADLSLPAPSLLRHETPPPATAAMTGSYDDPCTKFTAVVSVQSPTKANLIANAGPMFRELLERYIEKQTRLPEQIIYYRDGSSESEFETIKTQEYETLKRLCQEMGAPACKVTVILAVKRHHTRFFLPDTYKKYASRLGNVPSGTVVENSRQNDMFLVAHTDMQGTKRPTRYITLADEIGLTAVEFQRLTFSLCSTYARATTSVSVVPAVYYAHQVCERAHMHLEDRADGSRVLLDVHPRLKWTMWWQ